MNGAYVISLCPHGDEAIDSTHAINVRGERDQEIVRTQAMT